MSFPTVPNRSLRKRVLPKKLQAVLVLGASVLFISLSFQDDARMQRNLRKCKPISEILASLEEHQVRSLHRFSMNSTDFYERILELGGEGPCLIEYPPMVDQDPIADNETIAEKTEPEFEVATDDYYQHEEYEAKEVDGVVEIVPDADTATEMDQAERELVESFEPEEHNFENYETKDVEIGVEEEVVVQEEVEVEVPIYDDEGNATNATTTTTTIANVTKVINTTHVVEIPVSDPNPPDAGTIGYVLPLVGCPGWYTPPIDTTGEPPVASELYEAGSITKCMVCENSDTAAIKRGLGATRNLATLDGTSSAQMDYTIHALMHPMSVECPVGGDSSETYDRKKLMESLEFEVEIMGHAITEAKLADAGQWNVLENLEDDVGFRDSMKLHIWRMIAHPVVVLMNFNTLLHVSLDEEIDTLLADDSLKGMYILQAPENPWTGSAGVDTGLLIIKPDEEEYARILDAYLHTPNVPTWGWNAQGFNDFPGHLGLPGFLAYYFHDNPAYLQLDRCVYAHDADDVCNGNRDFESSKASKMGKDVCGAPRDCPYDNPMWSQTKKRSCESLHKKYYNFRYKFEERFFSKEKKQERIGFFKPNSFLGYCAGPGKALELSMTGNIVPKPEWQNVCPPTECPDGTYLKPDCTCTDPDFPCDACPSNTFCQKSPSLTCIDCSCGFCDGSGAECCSSDNNGCMAGSGDGTQCSMQNNFFPAFHGSGSVCGGVELARTAIPNGCGCKPSAHQPCSYNPEWVSSNDKCFICTAADIANGVKECSFCKTCLRGCRKSECLDTAATLDDVIQCLNEINHSTCRYSCHRFCMKN